MPDIPSSRPGSARETGAMLLAAGGLVAAFGAASCCALPLLLGGLGLGSVWLGSLALLAGPYQSILLLASLAFLAAGGAILWRQRALARACAPGAACGRPIVATLATGALSIGAVLLVLGYVFA
jgi:mercuric ion transport protein